MSGGSSLSLPVDSLKERLVAAHRDGAHLVLKAPTGSGKSTRVPLHLLDSGALGVVWMVEPRRLAVRTLARWVAGGIGEEPGGRVGYQVRFDRKVSDRTKVLFLTPGVALRLWEDPAIRASVSVVVLDEFHERGAEADALAALVLRDRLDGKGAALWILSATIDTIPFARSAGSRMVSLFTCALPPLSVLRDVTRPCATSMVRSIGFGNDGPCWM